MRHCLTPVSSDSGVNLWIYKCQLQAVDSSLAQKPLVSAVHLPPCQNQTMGNQVSIAQDEQDEAEFNHLVSAVEHAKRRARPVNVYDLESGGYMRSDYDRYPAAVLEPVAHIPYNDMVRLSHGGPQYYAAGRPTPLLPPAAEAPNTYATVVPPVHPVPIMQVRPGESSGIVIAEDTAHDYAASLEAGVIRVPECTAFSVSSFDWESLRARSPRYGAASRSRSSRSSRGRSMSPKPIIVHERSRSPTPPIVVRCGSARSGSYARYSPRSRSPARRPSRSPTPRFSRRSNISPNSWLAGRERIRSPASRSPTARRRSRSPVLVRTRMQRSRSPSRPSTVLIERCTRPRSRSSTRRYSISRSPIRSRSPTRQHSRSRSLAVSIYRARSRHRGRLLTPTQSSSPQRRTPILLVETGIPPCSRSRSRRRESLSPTRLLLSRRCGVGCRRSLSTRSPRRRSKSRSRSVSPLRELRDCGTLCPPIGPPVIGAIGTSQQFMSPRPL
ncbi:hypothetical protein BC835DRAFT_909589 [Cytidiella melzeri]|nr:hypothetical protein BC835DRAFT_909589 [Cytidiella melzeri]